MWNLKGQTLGSWPAAALAPCPRSRRRRGPCSQGGSCGEEPRALARLWSRRTRERTRGRAGTGWPCGAGRRAARAQPTPDTRQVGCAPPGPQPWKTPRAPGSGRLGEGGPRAPRGRGSERGAGRGPLSPCLGAHAGRSEQVEEPLGGTSGSDSLALSMLMRVQWLLSIWWIPSGWGGGFPEGQRQACPTRGPNRPAPHQLRPVAACQAQGHRLSGPGRPRPGRTELCSHSPPGRRCQGRGALVCHPSVRSLVVTLAPSAPTAS